MMCAVCMFDGRRQEELIDLKDGQIDKLRALLREARESWIKVGYGASHEDVADCSDLCRRIDAALAGQRREGE